MGMAGKKEHNRKAAEFEVLSEVTKTLAISTNPSEMLNSVMKTIGDVIEAAEAGMILLWDESLSVFRAEAALGYDLDELETVELMEGESVSGKVFLSDEARLYATHEEVERAITNIHSSNLAAIQKAHGKDELPACMLAAVLKVGERRYGVLHIENYRSPAKFTESDLTFIQTLADVIALALDRYRLEVHATKARDAETEDRMRSEIMATLSHELRTPLSAIKGYATAMLLEDVNWDNEKRVEFLQQIDNECDNLQSMIGEILDSSLIDVGQMVIEPQPIRMEMLVTEIANEFQRRAKNHRLVVDFPSGFPLLDADPGRIKQVIRNIVDNSIKYGPDGGLIVIRGTVRPNDVVISISDEGVGISPEDLIPLFEKYFRVKSPTGHHVAGTGLGLPVSRAIVEAHGGKIWAESKVDEGTTLYFSLPRGGISEREDNVHEAGTRPA